MEENNKTDSLDYKITLAQHRLEDIWFKTNGNCCISFSGGKDSTVMLALVKMCIELGTLPPEGIKAVFSNTGMELKATIDFVKWCKENWYENIDVCYPRKGKGFAYVIKHRGYPMLSKVKSNRLRTLYDDTLGWRPKHAKKVKDNLIHTTNAQFKIAKKYYHLLNDKFIINHPEIRPSSHCCNYLKKYPIADYQKTHNIKGAIIGVRADEGEQEKCKLNLERRSMMM